MVIVNYFLYFIIYSMIGWIYESILCSILERKWVNRGFLSGPVCPVYGTGAMISIIFLYGKTDNIFILFFTGMSLAGCIEYITAVLLEKIFKAKWWDYSNEIFNIQGRVCLKGLLVFSALIVCLIEFIHPFVISILDMLQNTFKITLAIIIFWVFAVDLVTTVKSLLQINNKLKEIQDAINNYKILKTRKADELKAKLLERFEESDFYTERIKNLLKKKEYGHSRLIKAFPKLEFIKYKEAWEKFKIEMQNKRK